MAWLCRAEDDNHLPVLYLVWQKKYLLCIQLHPMHKLVCDILISPLVYIKHIHPDIEGACKRVEAQVLYGRVVKVQVAVVHIL